MSIRVCLVTESISSFFVHKIKETYVIIQSALSLRRWAESTLFLIYRSITLNPSMTQIRILWLLLCLVWLASEIQLSRQSSKHLIMRSEHDSQQRLWLSLFVCLAMALVLKTLAWLPLPIPYLSRQAISLPFFLSGLGLRYWAIRQLGQFFTTNLQIQIHHRLILTGPYRKLRHPAYTGVLLALAAAGLAMGDGLALLVMVIPPFLAFNWRIEIEEQLLREQFGQSYQDYCQRSWKLLPWLY